MLNDIYIYHHKLGFDTYGAPYFSMVKGEYEFLVVLQKKYYNIGVLHPINLIFFLPKCSSLNKLSNGMLTSSMSAFLCQIH